MTDIDLVYLWVNGGDPKWIAKHDATIGRSTENQDNCKGRYAESGELKYSLRSIEKYAPWIHRIFIVTDDQTPDWLDMSNPKIQIVDHTEIIPKEYLPCFNSTVIEHFLCNIPGLAEHFLYANDDMFLNKPVSPETFFGKDGLPITRFCRRPFRKLSLQYRTKVLGKTLNNYKQIIHNAALLAEKEYGKYYTGKVHHNIDAYLKSTFLHTRQVFDKALTPTFINHKRSANDIHRSLYSYAALAEKQAHRKYVTQRTSFRLHIDNRRLYEKFRRYNPVFFCMNDSEFANDDDRAYADAFRSTLFPDKSSFEK